MLTLLIITEIMILREKMEESGSTTARYVAKKVIRE